MVSVAVTGAVPDIAAGTAAEQVGASIAPVGLEVTAQVSATLPTKPPLGVMVIVAVPLCPADAMLIGAPFSVKAGVAIGADTVMARLVVSTTLPELPVTVAE
jgi:hypothetical protein